MRVLRAAATSLGLALVLYLYLAFLHPVRPAGEHRFFEGSSTLVIAHQGGRGLRPENTMMAFEHAAALGVDVLEMDLRGSKDGRIVVLHDASVERTTDGRGLVHDLSLGEIEKLDAGYHFTDEAGTFPYRGKGVSIPTLDDVLARLPGRRLNLEMKDFEPTLARSLCDALRRFGAAERTLVASFDHEPMVAFRKACAEVATSATFREAFLFYQLQRVRLSSLFGSPAVAFELPEYFGRLRVVAPPFLELARSHNVRVQVWTVNEENDLGRFLDMGVDGILTDYPDRLLRLLGRI
jgi:glycerophosphoryl diester phosphodiesterase